MPKRRQSRDLSPEWCDAAVERLLAERCAQGLPEKVSDLGTLVQIAAILRAQDEEDAAGARTNRRPGGAEGRRAENP